MANPLNLPLFPPSLPTPLRSFWSSLSACAEQIVFVVHSSSLTYLLSGSHGLQPSYTHTPNPIPLYRKPFLSSLPHRIHPQLLFPLCLSQLVLVLIVLHPPHWPSLVVDGPARQSFPFPGFFPLQPAVLSPNTPLPTFVSTHLGCTTNRPPFVPHLLCTM